MSALSTETSPAPDSGLMSEARDAEIARRANQLRSLVIQMIHEAGSGHIGSSLSCADIVSVLKFDQMHWRADTPRSQSDVFVLSKGHAAPTWYAALALDGDIPAAELSTLRALDSRLQGHPDRRRLDLIDVSTGALGQGLSVSIGRALAKMSRGHGDHVYCVLGDGEMQEGQVWESVMFAGARRVSNVIAVVDHNKRQSEGSLEDVLPLTDLADKVRCFGWHVQEVDGHSVPALRRAFIAARGESDRPSAIIAHTQKGYLGPERIALKGSHSGAFTDDELSHALAFLGAGS